VTKFTILLSHERSGSHFLGEFIANLRSVTRFDEVGNPNAMVPGESRPSFFGFKHDYLLKNPDLLLRPTRDSQATFVAAYFDHLTSLAGDKQSVVVDIKYGHVQLFEKSWWPIFERPFLFHIAEERGVRILHLHRRNVVEAVASAMIAEARGVWHTWQERDKADRPNTFTLNPSRLVSRARLLEFQNRWFDASFIGNCERMSLTYEQLSAELGAEKKLGKEIAQFVGGSIGDAYTPRYQKVTPPLIDVVENYAAVRSACIAAGLGRYFPRSADD
jgi:LPS sulfotransferase NodH